MITSPQGFRAAAVAAGIKADRDDLALVVADRTCAAAAVFTQNRACAAPVAPDQIPDRLQSLTTRPTARSAGRLLEICGNCHTKFARMMCDCGSLFPSSRSASA